MIYFMRDTASGRIKIGHSTDPWARLSQVQCASPSEIVMLATEPGGVEREAELHQQFEAAWARGEWFEPSAAILNHIDTLAPAEKKTSATKSFWNGMMARDVAAAAGVSASLLSHIQHGIRRPSPELAIRLQEVTGRGAIQLVFGDLASQAK